MSKKIVASLLLIIFLLALVATYLFGRSLWMPIVQKIKGKNTVADIIDRYGIEARDSLIPYFKKAKINYPPKRMTFLATKDDGKLEVWASNNSSDNQYKFIRLYNIQKISGVLGPKLIEGDRQVPEGIYKISGLNPNSSYHLSMKINYPNEFDLKYAKLEGRTQPGTNIFIHGKSVSIGCLAMGDKTIEELFVLTNDVGRENVTVVIAPSNPRNQSLVYSGENKPAWVDNLYQNISVEFNKHQL